MATSHNSGRLFSGALVGFLMLSVAMATGQGKNSCLDCHSTLPEPLGVEPGKVQPGHTRSERLDLRQLPRRRSHERRCRTSHEPKGRLEGQD